MKVLNYCILLRKEPEGKSRRSILLSYANIIRYEKLLLQEMPLSIPKKIEVITGETSCPMQKF